MTDDYTSSYPRPTDSPSGTADTAKQEAGRLKNAAAQTGGRLLDDAKGEAAAVTQEARRQLGDLWSQARTEVSGELGSQQVRLAGGLTSVGGQLTRMASTTTEQNVATDIVREVGQRVDGLGQWLGSHGPDEILDEVRGFARRRPVAFLALAAGAGIVLGRLTRGLKDAPEREVPTTTAPVPVQADTTVGVTPYTDPVAERPRFSDDLASPVPSTAGWDER